MQVGKCGPLTEDCCMSLLLNHMTPKFLVLFFTLCLYAQPVCAPVNIGAIVDLRYIHSVTRYSKCCVVSDTSTHGVRGQWVIICLLLTLGYDQATFAARYDQAHSSPAVYLAYPRFKFDLQTGSLTAFYNPRSPSGNVPDSTSNCATNTSLHIMSTLSSPGIEFCRV